MKAYLLGLVAALALLGMTPASAGIVYTLTPETVGPLTVTGTITTDGNTGVLSAADVTAFNITISGNGSSGTSQGTSPFLVGPGGPATALVATSTTLTFLFSTIENQLAFGGVGGVYELLSGPGFVLENGSGTFSAPGPGTPSFVLATADPAPGPTYGAGLPGLIFAFGGLLFWHRRRQHACPDRSATANAGVPSSC